MSKPSAQQIATLFGCTVEQVKKLGRKNSAVCQKTAQKAEMGGRKINGYTAQQWREMSAESLRHK